ncbi:hypothetical protein TRVL_01676 [Trypanosoma vivax]|nr:hypothetical protein TRVL_01676 [Trypanosoma vivax]
MTEVTQIHSVVGEACENELECPSSTNQMSDTHSLEQLCVTAPPFCCTTLNPSAADALMKAGSAIAVFFCASWALTSAMTMTMRAVLSFMTVMCILSFLWFLTSLQGTGVIANTSQTAVATTLPEKPLLVEYTAALTNALILIVLHRCVPCYVIRLIPPTPTASSKSSVPGSQLKQELPAW